MREILYKYIYTYTYMRETKASNYTRDGIRGGDDGGNHHNTRIQTRETV